jgi:predicted CoA-binding protein
VRSPMVKVFCRATNAVGVLRDQLQAGVKMVEDGGGTSADSVSHLHPEKTLRCVEHWCGAALRKGQMWFCPHFSPT